MRNFLKTFLLSMFFVSGIIYPGVCGVGSTDDREYVSDEMWATEPYKRFVFLGVTILAFGSDGSLVGMQEGTCSAQYISHNLIVSAGHCVHSDADTYTAKNYKGESFSLGLLESHWDGADEGEDWALFLVKDPAYYSDSFFDIKEPTFDTDVINAGWGAVRILNDVELEKIRELTKNIKSLGSDDFYRVLKQKMQESGMQPLEEKPARLKASKCKIVFENTEQLPHSGHFPDILATTCDTWHGNSGGGYVSVSGNDLYGVASFNRAGYIEFDESGNSNYMASTKQFLDAVQRYKNQKDLSADNITPKIYIGKSAFTQNENNSVTSIQALEDRNHNLINSINALLSEPTLSNESLLLLLSTANEQAEVSSLLEFLKQSYEDAKAREQSKANRTLTAASIAATGIGGMELAQGLAEQKADKDAERSMDAYIATMRCKYGNSQVKAGLEEIELPGGNGSEFMNLRNEYFALAADLKERKEALGMKAGIESEVIMDKAEMGLYNNENAGITDGAYSSLYRAKMLNSEKDQTQIDESKETSQNRVIGGSVAAGTGVVGGITGDFLINGNRNNKK